MVAAFAARFQPARFFLCGLFSSGVSFKLGTACTLSSTELVTSICGASERSSSPIDDTWEKFSFSSVPITLVAADVPEYVRLSVLRRAEMPTGSLYRFGTRRGGSISLWLGILIAPLRGLEKGMLVLGSEVEMFRLPSSPPSSSSSFIMWGV